MRDQRLEKKAAAVLRERAGPSSHFEMGANFKNEYAYEPFALVEVRLPFGGGHGPAEQILHRGYDTAEAMYRDVITTYGKSPTAPTLEPTEKGTRPPLLTRIVAAFRPSTF